MNEDIYAITDIDGYANEMRKAAVYSFSDSSNDIDEYITINEVIGLIKSNCLGFDSKNRPLLNEDTNEKIYESTITWINNIGLAKLAAKGLVECAWDDESNEMVFWTNNKLNEKEKLDDKSNKRRNIKKNKGS